jgi:hypothetical protein
MSYHGQEHDFQEWYSSLCNDQMAQQSRRFFANHHAILQNQSQPDSRNLRLSNYCMEEEDDESISIMSSPQSDSFSPAIHRTAAASAGNSYQAEKIPISKSISLEDYQDYTRSYGSVSEPTALNLLLVPPPEESENVNLALRNMQTPTGIPPHYALESPNLFFPVRKYE